MSTCYFCVFQPKHGPKYGPGYVACRIDILSTHDPHVCVVLTRPKIFRVVSCFRSCQKTVP